MLLAIKKKNIVQDAVSKSCIRWFLKKSDAKCESRRYVKANSRTEGNSQGMVILH